MTMPTLPQAVPDATYTPPTGTTRLVHAGGNLQAALDAAKPGDRIVLDAGATWTGAFRLNDRTAGAPIHIQTSALDQLPPPGTMVTAADAAKMPKIYNTVPQGALQINTPGAGNVRFVGLEVAVAPGYTPQQYGIMTLGLSTATTPETQARDVSIDRCYIHGQTDSASRQGVVLNCANSVIVDSLIVEFHTVGADSQAVLSWNGVGPFLFRNCRFEGAGENVMFGGSDSRSDAMVPRDITIDRCTFEKPDAWRSTSFVVKNLLELKSAQRVRLVGCRLIRCWTGGQYGVGIVVKSSNQGGNAPWGNTSDVTIEDCELSLLEEGIHLMGRTTPTGVTDPPMTDHATARVHLRNVLFEDIVGKRAILMSGGGVKKDAAGNVVEFKAVDDTTIESCTFHNTASGTGSLIMFSGRNSGIYATAERLKFVDNIAGHGRYGLMTGEGEGNSTAAVARYAPGMEFTRNKIVGAGSQQNLYPSGNTFVPLWDNVGFADLAGGDYHVSTPPGADVDAIDAAFEGDSTPPDPPPDGGTCEEELAAANARIAELEAQVADLTTQVDTLQTELTEANARVAELEALVAERDAQVAELQAELATATARVAELETEVASLQTELTAADALVAEKDAEIARLRSAIDTADDALDAVDEPPAN